MTEIARFGMVLVIATASALMIVNWALHLMVQFTVCS